MVPTSKLILLLLVSAFPDIIYLLYTFSYLINVDYFSLLVHGSFPEGISINMMVLFDGEAEGNANVRAHLN